jgi:MFS family permease
MAMIMAGVVRAALPVLGTDVRADLGLTRAEFGGVLTTFLVALAISAPLTGRLADTLGGRRMLFIRLGAASVGLVMTAAAPSLWWLGAAVAFTGIGLSAGNPATNKLIADHLPPGSRGTILGIKQSGGQMGVLLAGAVLPVLATIWSWEAAILAAVTMPALTALLLVTMVPPDPPRRTWRSSARLTDDERRGLGRLLVIGALMGAGIQSAFGFLPLYAVERLGLATTTAGLVAAAVATASSIGRVLWARAAERATTIAIPAGLLASGAATGVAMVGLSAVLGTWALWTGAVLLGGTAESWNAVANFAVIGIAGHESTGRATGVLNSVALAGGAVGPIVFGILVDATDSYVPAWIGCGAMFCAAGLTALVWRRSVR